MAEEKITLGAALALAQADFPPIERTKTVKVTTKTGGSYSFAYAPLDSILNAVRPALAEHGLAITQLLTSAGNGMALETCLIHKSGEKISGVFPLPTTNGIGPQELGSLLTYVRRYALVAILGIATEEDDDGNRASAARDRGDYMPPTRVEPQAKRPESWSQLAAGFDALEVDPVWLQQAVREYLGKDTAELDPKEKELAFQLLASVLMRLQDGEAGLPETVGGYSREQLQKTFAQLLEGKVLEGPPWRIAMEDKTSERPSKSEWDEARTVPGEDPAIELGEPSQ